jgi:hypothetical protein
MSYLLLEKAEEALASTVRGFFLMKKPGCRGLAGAGFLSAD